MASISSGSHALAGSPDGVVERVIAESDAAALSRGRAAFEERTGAFAPEDPFFEERARAAFEHAVVEHEGGALLRGWIDRHPEHRETALAVGRRLRGLFAVTRVEAHVHLVELFGGAPMRVAKIGVGERLRGGDRFDGRVVSDGGELRVLAGVVFHPAEAHSAIDELLTHARASHRPMPAMLDGLLRMRMRFDRFTGMHAKHVYRWDAIDKTEILAASWARPRS